MLGQMKQVTLCMIYGDVRSGEEEGDIVYGVRQMPTRKFIWNKYLLKDVEGKVHHTWIIFIIHGFIGQQSIPTS